ncbi:hypothetical protein BOTBODRAFT_170987 [Botryobasidium botryosum FD-172 SS1]|uniref:GATA-type domain-containing protein n=1 Tax=Botryobasidium botryosum (strain FD-172 SS1) TaxID=930990 RepID=A0A067MWD4_BOTB1|nr:hypothetical protein BOTBODRAFT_170987 [Botryobasidium botryosum FD-172 SS1]
MSSIATASHPLPRLPHATSLDSPYSHSPSPSPNPSLALSLSANPNLPPSPDLVVDPALELISAQQYADGDGGAPNYTLAKPSDSGFSGSGSSGEMDGSNGGNGGTAQAAGGAGITCVSCGTTTTPLWRRDPAGKSAFTQNHVVFARAVRPRPPLHPIFLPQATVPRRSR